MGTTRNDEWRKGFYRRRSHEVECDQRQRRRTEASRATPGVSGGEQDSHDLYRWLDRGGFAVAGQEAPPGPLPLWYGDWPTSQCKPQYSESTSPRVVGQVGSRVLYSRSWDGVYLRRLQPSRASLLRRVLRWWHSGGLLRGSRLAPEDSRRDGDRTDAG